MDGHLMEMTITISLKFHLFWHLLSVLSQTNQPFLRFRQAPWSEKISEK